MVFLDGYRTKTNLEFYLKQQKCLTSTAHVNIRHFILLTFHGYRNCCLIIVLANNIYTGQRPKSTKFWRSLTREICCHTLNECQLIKNSLCCVTLINLVSFGQERHQIEIESPNLVSFLTEWHQIWCHSVKNERFRSRTTPTRSWPKAFSQERVERIFYDRC